MLAFEEELVFDFRKQLSVSFYEVYEQNFHEAWVLTRNLMNDFTAKTAVAIYELTGTTTPEREAILDMIEIFIKANTEKGKKAPTIPRVYEELRKKMDARDKKNSTRVVKHGKMTIAEYRKLDKTKINLVESKEESIVSTTRQEIVKKEK